MPRGWEELPQNKSEAVVRVESERKESQDAGLFMGGIPAINSRCAGESVRYDADVQVPTLQNVI
ncbi:hypothetical protein PHLCEN_2v996 [Hermanssonia centrifuga]|uniref:Uncharacterized protein n=1 Tax=Hermanssonia centrifuga TaxID=98765 RepID=A0A2R6S4E4_9APHY|nr:hypothetical protein PHLCEN_2v996 [Hermanssonia centrifuga]